MNPYKADGNPNHPGVAGRAFHEGAVPMDNSVLPGKIDSTGTGTFPPEAQGNVGRAQPTGLSASTQYGLASPGQILGESSLAGPATHPLPNEAEDGAIGLAPKPVNKESLEATRRENLEAELQRLNESQAASAGQAAVQRQAAGQTNEQVPTDAERKAAEEEARRRMDEEEDEEDA